MTVALRVYDPDNDLAAITEATKAFIETLRGLSDAELAVPSLLPRWSRSHVANHVARNADGNRNLLRWARTGIVTPMYNSPTARDADIEAGVGRARDAIIADIEASHERLLGEASELPAESWQAVVRIAGTEAPASYVLYARLVELQVHHVDLAAAYSPAHWPAHFTERLLTTVVEQLNTRADSPALWLRADDSRQELAIHQESGAPRVHGPAPALLAWLIGRANGDGLAVDPRGALPRPPAWL